MRQSSIASLAVLLAACTSSSSTTPPLDAVAIAPPPAPTVASAPKHAAPDAINPRLLRRFQPLDQAAAPENPALVDLGRMLFFDKRLSRDRDVSCNSCHRLDRYGVDHEATSTGARGKRGRRNAPTVYNAAGHVRAFWDGRAADLAEQAKGPILNPLEMAMPDGASVVRVLVAIPGYVTAFERAFPGAARPITYDHVGRAIAAFEKGLVTPSRWDRYLAGDASALTKREVAGLRLFSDTGCMACHTGRYLGGSSFQKAGVTRPWPNQRDQGRFEVTAAPADRMVFKVPGLRNVAMTAPYFHDGSAKTLEEAVGTMARVQLGEELSTEDIGLIVAWLGTLTGELPTEYIREPALP
ncbi:MAG: c-type cytochrome [Deltaproteobacteria bacterium]|nr:c-type cytochrome [Deltaproteobacteria bacterium]